MNLFKTKALTKIITVVCCLAMLVSLVPASVTATDTTAIDAQVKLITNADNTQDKLRIIVNGESDFTWISVTVYDEEGDLCGAYQDRNIVRNVFDFNLVTPGRAIAVGEDVKVVVSVTRPSGTVLNKTFTVRYWSFAHQQTAISNILNIAVPMTTADAEILSIDTEGDFGLLTNEGKLFVQQTLVDEYASQPQPDPEAFQISADAAIKLGLINSKSGSLIARYIDREKTAIGIDLLPEFAEYTALSTADKNAVNDKLALGTYNTVAEFAEIFQGEVFLHSISKKHKSNVVLFIQANYQRQSNAGNPLTLNFAAYNLLSDIQKDYFSTLITARKYTSIGEFEAEFNAAITAASNYVEPAPTTPTTPAGGGGGSDSIGTVSGGAGSIVVPPIVTPPSAGGFKDIASVPWAAEAIINLAKDGVLNGVDGENFDPEGIVTREQFVKMIIAALKLTGSADVSKFADVVNGEWYAGYISAAIANDIINGTSDGEFGIGNNISRQDMSVIIYRAAEKAGIVLPEVTNDLPSDIDSVADYAKTAVIALYKAGIINGMGDGRFAPAENASRAQAAKIIYGVRGFVK